MKNPSLHILQWSGTVGWHPDAFNFFVIHLPYFFINFLQISFYCSYSGRNYNYFYILHCTMCSSVEFTDFQHQCCSTLNPDSPFVRNWHILPKYAHICIHIQSSSSIFFFYFFVLSRPFLLVHSLPLRNVGLSSKILNQPQLVLAPWAPLLSGRNPTCRRRPRLGPCGSVASADSLGNLSWALVIF